MKNDPVNPDRQVEEQEEGVEDRVEPKPGAKHGLKSPILYLLDRRLQPSGEGLKKFCSFQKRLVDLPAQLLDRSVSAKLSCEARYLSLVSFYKMMPRHHLFL